MPARDVVIYTTMYCSFCRRAKTLLARKGVEFNEISVDGDPAAREAMAARASGRRTVPQIFVGDRWIGGCDELYALDAGGKLDELLFAPAA